MISEKIYFIIFSLIFSLQLFPQTQKIDSLTQLIKISKGEKKMDLMIELANSYLTRENKYELSHKLKDEALKHENMKYVAASYILKAESFVGSNMVDSTIYYAELANDTYKKYNIKNSNESYKLIAKAYIYNGFYELGLHNIKKYMEEAKSLDVYTMMVEVYLITGRYDLAKEIAIKVIADLPTPQSDKISHIEYFMYDVLTLAHMYTQDYDEALRCCTIMQNILDRDKSSDERTSFYECHIYALYATIYTRKNDAKNAKKYLDKMRKMPKGESFPILQSELNRTLGEYYLLTKDYNKALLHIDKSLNSYKDQIPLYYLYLEASGIKIKILEGLNRYKEALCLQKELSNYQDSIYQVNMPLQMMKLTNSYEVEQHKLEQEKNEAELAKSKTLNIGLIIMALLLFVILYVIYKNSINHKNKNQVLLKKCKEIDNYLSLIRSSKPLDINNQGVHSILFKDIDNYMLEEKAYTYPNLTREDVAQQLNTNRRYVTEAIKEATGQTFSDYITLYRLNYARKLLLSDNKKTVNRIAFESGFSSISTFYRLFKAEFGMTPNELREAQKIMQSEIRNI